MLLDLDEGIQEWRYRHMKLVERIIGMGTLGTAGSNGFEYFSEEALNLYARRFDAMGLGLHFHATGDKGAGIALDVVADAAITNSNKGVPSAIIVLA